MTRRAAIDPSMVTPETPLRLDVAAGLAYPDGSMTVSGLRREASRGRLDIERTAGKDYTTLAAIERMRKACRVPPKAPDSGSGETKAVPRSGSSKTPENDTALVAAKMTAQALKNGSRLTSPPNTRRRAITEYGDMTIRDFEEAKKIVADCQTRSAPRDIDRCSLSYPDLRLLPYPKCYHCPDGKGGAQPRGIVEAVRREHAMREARKRGR